MVRRLQKLYVHASYDPLHALSYSAKYDLVLDNNFKQTPHHLNQPYLMWAAVLCQRSSRNLELARSRFSSEGIWAPDAAWEGRFGLVHMLKKGGAIEDDVQPAN